MIVDCDQLMNLFDHAIKEAATHHDILSALENSTVIVIDNEENILAEGYLLRLNVLRIHSPLQPPSVGLCLWGASGGRRKYADLVSRISYIFLN